MRNKRPRQKTAAELQAEVDAFNRTAKPGDAVTVQKDDGTTITTTLTHPASVMGGHTAVAWVDGISGAYLLSRIKPAKTPAHQPAAAE